jgi:hypothetical protein
MGKRKPSIGAPKRRVRQNRIRNINNPYGRNGRTNPVIVQETSSEASSLPQTADGILPKNQLGILPKNQLPLPSSLPQTADGIVPKNQLGILPKNQLPLPPAVHIVENADGTVTMSFTATREELNTVLHSKKQCALSAFSDLSKMPFSSTTMCAIPPDGVARRSTEQSTEAVVPPRLGCIDPLTFRRSPVDFSNLPVRNLDLQAFREGSKNANSARVAKHRAIRKIITAVKEAGTFDQQSLALLGALVHPDLRDVSKSAGYCPEDFTEEVRTASFQINQVRRALKLARTTNKKRGRCSDVKDSLVQSVMTAVAPSPNLELGKNGLPTRRQLMVSLGFERTGASRLLFSQASSRRTRIRELQATEDDWSTRRKKPKQLLKVNENLRKLLDNWIRNHDMVVESPIKDETLLVLNPSTGIKERKAKLLLCVPVRELHNDLVKEPPIGLAEAKDANNKCVISDTMLRSLLPAELKPATKRHKQMCGCETCLSFRSLHCSLNAFRNRRIQFFENDPNNLLDANGLEANQFEAYRQMVRPDDTGHWHKKPADAVNQVMCPTVHETLRHFKCALRRCQNCPEYPIPLLEQDASDDAPRIIFHVYKKVTKCSKHGLLQANAKTCGSCEDLAAILLNTGSKSGRVRTRKMLSRMELSIGIFFTDYYLPALELYCYHLQTVILLSKYQTGKSRQEAIQRLPWSALTRRDYAERLNAKFNLEIQSDHFGNDRDLSIEGVSVHLHTLESLTAYAETHEIWNLNEPRMEFHSHFSDNSKQDAATTHEHMDRLVNLLLQRGVLKCGGWILDHTDGCAKQYRCGTALYLLALLAVSYGIVVDWAIGAPGHGKCEVDGANAVDKRFIETKMCLIEAPDCEASSRRMSAHAMAGEALTSFAAECARICSTRERSEGVKSEMKSKKREDSSRMKARFYHVEDQSLVRFGSVKMKAVGFQSSRGETRNGISAMYNLRADPDLGMHRIAVRRIPCACIPCIAQLQRLWLPGVTAKEQPRYSRNSQCTLFGIFDGLNDWQIIGLSPNANSNDDEMEEAQAYALKGIETINSELVENGNYGAFSTDDPDADGYYIVQWTGDPFTLQDDLLLESTDCIPLGEIVCEAIFFSKIPRANRWYIPEKNLNGDSLFTTVRMKQVVAPNLLLEGLSNQNRLPNGCNTHQITPLGPVRISEYQHCSVLDEIARVEEMDCEEDGLDESGDEENSHDGRNSDDGSVISDSGSDDGSVST